VTDFNYASRKLSLM